MTLICPARNEADGIERFLQTLDEALAAQSGLYRFRVAIIDDGSSDATAALAQRYRPRHFSLIVCRLTRNFGKEAAMLAGLARYADDANIIMDVDLQHPPALIAGMLQAWRAGARVVDAVKADRGRESWMYRLAAANFYRLMHAFGGLALEGLSDFKLLDREVVLLLNQLPEKTRFFRGLVQWGGFSSVRLPFEVPQRADGRSAWSVLDLAKYAARNLSAFTSAPLHLVTLLGMLTLVVSVVMGLVTLVQWFEGQAVTGFTTVILLLLFIGSMLMISLGIIGFYLSRIYDEIKSRPAYVVAEESITPPD
ncbi:MAG: glycosyltransferase family 2 protein [Brachymonas sp.]|nr:glycosyltransferase family 2 protein [Brachymonas sp.]